MSTKIYSSNTFTSLDEINSNAIFKPPSFLFKDTLDEKIEKRFSGGFLPIEITDYIMKIKKDTEINDEKIANQKVDDYIKSQNVLIKEIAEYVDESLNIDNIKTHKQLHNDFNLHRVCEAFEIIVMDNLWANGYRKKGSDSIGVKYGSSCSLTFNHGESVADNKRRCRQLWKDLKIVLVLPNLPQRQCGGKATKL